MMDHQHTKLPQIGYGTNPYRTPSIMPSAASYCKQLETFWRKQMKEIEEAGDCKSHSLPLARIKKIMKADEDVKMISAEAPVVFAKACEMFILEITLRSWMHTEENKRRTLQKNDIAAAIGRTDIFDFLVDIVPRNDYKDDDGVLVIPRPLLGSTSALADNAPLPPLSSYYYVSQPSPSGGISGGHRSPSLPLPLPLPHPQQVWPKARLNPPPHTAT